MSGKGQHYPYPPFPHPGQLSSFSSLQRSTTDLSGGAAAAAALRGATLAFSAAQQQQERHPRPQAADHAPLQTQRQQASLTLKDDVRGTAQGPNTIQHHYRAIDNPALVAATSAAASRDHSVSRSPLPHHHRPTTDADSGRLSRQMTGGSSVHENSGSGRGVQVYDDPDARRRGSQASLAGEYAYNVTGSNSVVNGAYLASPSANSGHQQQQQRLHYGVGAGAGTGVGLPKTTVNRPSTSFIAASLAVSRSASPSPHRASGGVVGKDSRWPVGLTDASKDVSQHLLQQPSTAAPDSMPDTTPIPPTGRLVAMFEGGSKEGLKDWPVEGQQRSPPQNHADGVMDAGEALIGKAALRRSLATIRPPTPPRARSPEPKARTGMSLQRTHSAGRMGEVAEGVASSMAGQGAVSPSPRRTVLSSLKARPPTPPKRKSTEVTLAEPSVARPQSSSSSTASDSSGSTDTFVSASSVGTAAPQPVISGSGITTVGQPLPLLGPQQPPPAGPDSHADMSSMGRGPRARMPAGQLIDKHRRNMGGPRSTHSNRTSPTRSNFSDTSAAVAFNRRLTASNTGGNVAASSAASSATHLPLDSLSDAIVAGSLASTLHPLSGGGAQSSSSSRRSWHHDYHHSRIMHGGGGGTQRQISPQHSGGAFPTTLRPSREPNTGDKKKKKSKKGSSSDNSDPDWPKRKNKSGKSGVLGSKKHAHHEGDRRRWRDALTERQRRRYEAVWASNRGLHLEAYDDRTGSGGGGANAPDVELDSEMHPSQRVANVVVRDIWSRSRLPRDELAEVWDLVDRAHNGSLSRREFVVGLWLIDQRLRGRKIPVKVRDSVWASAGPASTWSAASHGGKRNS